MVAQAAVDEETILTATVSMEAVLQAKGFIDVSGHYSRPDVLQLRVNRRPLARLVEARPNDQATTTSGGSIAIDGPSEGNEHETAAEATSSP